MFVRMTMTARFGIFALLSVFTLNACNNASAAPAKEHVAAQATPSRSEVRQALAKHRAEQIERLHAYAETGAFPHNYASAEPLHMFKDANGRLCAVANLVNQDGLVELVSATARDRNDLAFVDVKDGPLYNWAIDSGLTLEEIARIQKPAPMIHEPGPPVRPAAKTNVRPMHNAKVNKPNLVIVNKVVDEETMRKQVREHFAAVEAELRASSEKSLNIAVERWFTNRS